MSQSDQLDATEDRFTFGCPCCPKFETYSENRLHDHFSTDDCPFWEKVFNGEVRIA